MQYPLRADFIYDYKKRKKREREEKEFNPFCTESCSPAWCVELCTLFHVLCHSRGCLVPDFSFTYQDRSLWNIHLQCKWDSYIFLFTWHAMLHVLSLSLASLSFWVCFEKRTIQLYYITSLIHFIYQFTTLTNMWVQIVCRNALLVRKYPRRHLNFPQT